MASADDRSLTEVLRDIVGNVEQIVRAEIRLVKVETREELVKAKRGALLLGAGVLIGVLAAGVVLLSAIYLLSTVMPPWLAALIVGAIAAVVAVMSAAAGARQFQQMTSLPKTTAAVQETIQWAKMQAR